MKNTSTKLSTGIQIHNPHFITYTDETFVVDILGGVDLSQVERMVCTLRIAYSDYSPHRTTLDLYNDNQTDKLIRSLCDKWELKLTDVSRSLHELTMQLETHRLKELRFMGKSSKQQFTYSQEDKKRALQLLKSKNLLAELTKHLNTTGILGEDENAVILFLALTSYKFNNPFSVLCLAKSGIGKSYILQKLSECMPDGSYSFHTKISANALYYFDSHSIQDKALMIEDLEWTTQMLSPLATLQTQGRLVNTRATKDKDGMLHSTTFEVVAKLCLIACAYSDKNFEEISLPFLCLHLNHSQSQDILIMEYQKKYKAGLIKTDEIKSVQHLLKCVIASLENIQVINPFATLIDLPKDVAYPRKSLLLLLNFIEVITYFFQHQRKQTVDTATGEVMIQTHPDDIELAFKFLKNNLFRRADELSTSARGFYHWLTQFLTEAKTNQFTALDIRKAKAIHPRTLNRYLQELTLFAYVQVAGGNKHRGGFIYKLTGLGNQSDVQNRIAQDIERTIKAVREAHFKQVENEKLKVENENEQPIQLSKEPVTAEEPQIFKTSESSTEAVQNPSTGAPQGADYIYKTICTSSHRIFTTQQICALTGKAKQTVNQHLKALFDKGLLTRDMAGGTYHYRLSQTVSQTPVTNFQNPAIQATDSRTTTN